MKVFISWSGDTSKKIASALYEWLPMVIQNVEAYMSAEEIGKGSRWSTDIAKELSETNFGVLCLTPSNVEAPWILFEAGALAKMLEQGRISPLLFALKPSDIQGPLSQFQATTFDEGEMRRLIQSINSARAEGALEEPRLDKIFAALWPQLKQAISEILQKATDTKANLKTRPTAEAEVARFDQILEEMLVLNRQQSQLLSSPDFFRPIFEMLEVLRRNESGENTLPPSHPIWEDLWISWRRVYDRIRSGAMAPMTTLDWQDLEKNAARFGELVEFLFVHSNSGRHRTLRSRAGLRLKKEEMAQTKPSDPPLTREAVFGNDPKGPDGIING